MSPNRRHALLRIAIIGGVLVALNVLLQAFPQLFSAVSLDVTADRRFSLTAPTKNLLRSLDSDVTIEVYLDGDFPAGFKRLQSSVRNLLSDFRNYSGRIKFSFINPNGGTVTQQNSFRTKLKDDGIMPTKLQMKAAESYEEKYIFPAAKVYHKGHYAVVNLLENQSPGQDQELILNNSVNLLEYKFINAISKLNASAAPVIGFTTGHGELDAAHTADLERSLDEFYQVIHIPLDSSIQIKPQVKVLIVAQPRTEFSEKNKFVFDQYVMNGGKIIWLIDAVNVATDSLMRRKEFAPSNFTLGLDDLLFRYGARINPNTVVDMRSSRIALQVGQQGNAPQYELFPWFYHVIAVPDPESHIIVKNLDGISLKFASTIDTIRTKTPVRKTVLLHSSDRTFVKFLPYPLNFDIARQRPDPNYFKKGNQPLALLLEGTFPSLYEKRVSEEMENGLKSLGLTYKSQSPPTKMIVVADGDVAANGVDLEKKTFKPLGYDKFEQYTFANKSFLLNCVEYLLDNHDLLQARAKEVKLRKLNTSAAHSNALFWQAVNIGLPLLLLVAFGWLFNTWRKRRYQ